MKRVLDSSVGIKWVIPEPDSAKAIQLLDDFHQQIVELISPDIFMVEAAHAITRAERQKRITPAAGAKALTDIFNWRPDLVPYLPLLPRAFAISSARGCVRLHLRGLGGARGLRAGHGG